MAKAAKAPTTPDLDERQREYLALVRRAEQGDQPALEGLRALYDQMPALWEATGNLAKQAEYSWIKTAMGKNLAGQEALERKAKALRSELAGQAPSPLEALLVERIIACWLQLNYVETLHAQRLQGELSWKATDHYQDWLDHAHRRYLTAIRTLAQVRKLLVPVVQVNIAEKQVNVGALVSQPGLEP